MIGQLLDGRYQILEVIESTELGKAYLAKDIRRPGDSLCFIKHLHLVAEDPEFVEIVRHRFQQEAQTLEKLSLHDQIPQLLAYFEENQEFYLVESYVPGHSLAHEIQPGHPWSEEDVIYILTEVLEILIFVHGQGVIHRDIKPSNLIRRDTDGKLVLLDFGAVKEINLTQNHNPPTARVGTIEYMPVEQFECNPHLNSDIYALGMMGIQALTGLPIYELRKLRETNPYKGGEIAWRHLAIVSQDLGDILDKMVRYDYRKRYQSSGEVLVELRKLGDRFETLAGKKETYREEVKRCADNRGDISVVGRKILDELRWSLELLPEEAEIVEDELLNPYRKYREKGERYEQALKEALQQQYPLSDETRMELKRLQQILGLLEEDAALIEKQVLPDSLIDKILNVFDRWKSNRVQSNRVEDQPLLPPTATFPLSRSNRLNPWLLVGTALAALLAISLAVMQYYRWQENKIAQQRQQQLDIQYLNRVQAFLDQDNYELCVNEGQKITEKSTQYLAVQELLRNCKDALNWRAVQVQDFAQHQDAVNAVQFSPDGTQIASGSSDQTVKIWEVPTGTLLQNFDGDFSSINSVDFSLDGQEIAAGSAYWRILEWSLETGELFIPLEHQASIWSVVISPDERTIASASADQTVKVWDRQTGFILYNFTEHTDIVYSLDLSPNGRKLVSGSKDNTIKIMDLETGTIINTLEGHTDEVRSVVISPDSQKIISGSYDDTVRIWDLETGRLLKTLTGHSGDVLAVAISPDSTLVASASKDRTIKLWDVETGELLNTLTGHTNEVYTVTFSPNGKMLVSGGKDRQIKLWKK